ncbi:MAG: HemK family protein methyltransferase [Planctomycetota bacterium]|jgi:release factor glutamine methyltransferase|nr:HemK family protein methyltransferase [Planctomycetota bacterium]
MPGPGIWKPLELVKVTADYLASKQVPNPRLDAELLLLGAMGLKQRVDLYAGFEREISGKELAAYRELIKRRAAREPVSRILKRRDFMGIGFRVTPDVLSPRPETELLVEAALEALRTESPGGCAGSGENRSGLETGGEIAPDELNRLMDEYAEDSAGDELSEPEPPRPAPDSSPRPPPAAGKRMEAGGGGRGRKVITDAVRILDLGTGSGCIAVALAVNLPGARIVAIDSSAKALAVAERNAAGAGVADRLDFRRGDWLEGCREGERFALILCNPPYLVEGDLSIWPEVSLFDPPAALYAGRDGLDCFRRIIPGSPGRLEPGGRIIFEVGAGQAPKVRELLAAAGYAGTSVVRDYDGTERVVAGTKPGGRDVPGK